PSYKRVVAGSNPAGSTARLRRERDPRNKYMANLRLLVNRRKAIRNIRKITRTMELIATARFKKAMDRATEAAAYTRKIAELAADVSASAGGVSHPLLEKREVKRSLLLIIAANRGL